MVQALAFTFSAGMLACFIFAFVIALCYVAAFLVGGDFARALCTFLSQKVLPPAYVVSGVIAIIGMIKMYLNGEKTFLMDLKRKNKT